MYIKEAERIKYKEYYVDVTYMDKNKRLMIIMSVVLLAAVFSVTRFFGLVNKDKKTNKQHSSQDEKSNKENNKEEIVIVLDAGHGGIDPGKVGVNGQLEKDINLQIVLKLKEVLEKDETLKATVVLTRSDDTGNYKESDTHKKRADMKKRIEIVEEASPDLLISIHQNSYISSNVKGAQVFYYEKSEKGKTLANKIQGCLVKELADENKGRVEKANDNYFLITNVECPAVIVECGFLSNEDEAKLLSDDTYQDKIAKTIVDGIREYLGNIYKNTNRHLLFRVL